MAIAAWIIFAAHALGARADDGRVEIVNGAAHLMKDQGSIRMVSEVVRARISVDLIVVDCVFVMKNEGPTDTVFVGFPDGSRGRYSHEREIESFRSWVDGAEVHCHRIPDADSTSYESDQPAWWTKRVAFPRGAVRTMRERYTVQPCWYPMRGVQGFRYVLETGASWKGTIGTADIRATLDGIPLERVTGTEPQARRVGRTFYWSFRNFEPGSADGSPAAVAFEWRESGRDGTSNR